MTEPIDPCFSRFIRDYVEQPPYMRAELFARLDACRQWRKRLATSSSAPASTSTEIPTSGGADAR